MRCYVQNILIIIVFSLANSFRIVSPKNTIGKQFTQHNITFVLRFSSYFFSHLFLVSRLVNRLQCHHYFFNKSHDNIHIYILRNLCSNSLFWCSNSLSYVSVALAWNTNHFGKGNSKGSFHNQGANF